MSTAVLAQRVIKFKPMLESMRRAAYYNTDHEQTENKMNLLHSFPCFRRSNLLRLNTFFLPSTVNPRYNLRLYNYLLQWTLVTISNCTTFSYLLQWQSQIVQLFPTFYSQPSLQSQIVQLFPTFYSEPSIQRLNLFPKMLELKWIYCNCKESLNAAEWY